VTFGSGSNLVRIGARAFAHLLSLNSISIPASVESLGEGCFSECMSLWSVTFESGSKLVRIHYQAYAGCGSLKSIVIPRSIRELVKGWADESSLEHVTFESAASLQRMIDGDCVDLIGGFAIKIANCDSDIALLRSSIGRDSIIFRIWSIENHFISKQVQWELLFLFTQYNHDRFNTRVKHYANLRCDLWFNSFHGGNSATH
jgi:hypothetical protein